MSKQYRSARALGWAVAAVAAMFVLGGTCQDVTAPHGGSTMMHSHTRRQDVTLIEGYEATRLVTGHLIVFEQVEQDSRCPQDAVCPWVGKAKGRFTLIMPGGGSTTFALEINGGVTAADTLKNGPLGFLSTDVGRLRLTLMQLDPYPLAGRDPLTLTSTALVRVQY